jgi:antitoxin YefM
MESVSYTTLRQNLARYLDQAVEDRAPILVTRQGGKGSVVILSADDFAGWQETVYLLSNAANATHLVESIRAADAGQTIERALIAPDDAGGG